MQKRIIISLCTLIIGITIYYCFYWDILIVNTNYSAFFRNYVPDFLWMISFYLFSINFTKQLTSKYILLTSIYAFILGLLFELLQFFNIVSGTFDILDIITYVIAIIFACIVEKIIWRYENEKIKN